MPKDHTVYGSIDIISHVLEGYISGQGKAPISDRISEGIVKTVIDSTETVMEKPGDLQARSDLMWCSTLALSGFQNEGYGDQHFNAHTIEHEISAALDIAHGAGLAIVLPGVMKYNGKRRPAKIA